eukprot:maker-scaffold168_size293125-snap-gene-1.87 protein:Tk04491 transcript:maker-scaffold168_size293125-snap-gene-1.87-mRNA-1 annotation:"low quality protein: dol-p-man:man c -pp-dol alpha- -mannosyltransferase"
MKLRRVWASMIEDVLPVAVAAFYMWMCPFTKVEESFNLQASHDLLYLGRDLSHYDHHEFPGVVPRTFLGPILVSALAYPFIHFVDLEPSTKFTSQLLVRGVLALLVLASLQRFRRALRRLLGPDLGLWHSLLTVSQFHFLFYASRPLPNTFALIFVLQALAAWLNAQRFQFILLSGVAVLIFRGELAMFLGIFVLLDLFRGQLSIGRALGYGLPCLIASLALTIGVDSYFWQRSLWPEGEVLYYNVIQNQSHNWGTSPWAWYFYSALPRALGLSACLVPLGLQLDPRTFRLVAPALTFVFLYSFLPHKELRFIIYVLPVLNVAAAAACQRIWRNASKSLGWTLLAVGVVAHLVANFLFCSVMLLVSKANYPGGQALMQLQNLVSAQASAHVHLDVLSCQTGISRFTQLYDNWSYRKDENLSTAQLSEFSHLLREVSEANPPKGFRVLDTIQQYAGIGFDYRWLPPLQIKYKPAIHLLERTETI